MMQRFTENCPNCGGRMAVRHLCCTDCDLKLEGDVQLPHLVKLSPEDREFIELFVVSGGSLKDVGQILGVSYPTVRSKLDRIIAQLKQLRGNEERDRLTILDRLERGEIDAKEAARLLRGHSDPKTQDKI